MADRQASPSADRFVQERLPPRAPLPDLIAAAPGYPDRLNATAVLLDEALAEGHAARPAIVTDRRVSGATRTSPVM